MSENTPYYADDQAPLWLGDALDALRQMPEQSVNCIVTSPPSRITDYATTAHLASTGWKQRRRSTWRPCGPCSPRRGECLPTTERCGSTSATATAPAHPAREETPPLNGKNAGARLREQARAAGIGRTKFMPPKNMLGMPWRTAFALQEDGWILRNEVIWNKPKRRSVSHREFSTWAVLSDRYASVSRLDRRRLRCCLSLS